METEATSTIPLLKALHLVALVTYFAGTFHIVRLFVAHHAALAKWEPERGVLHTEFTAMERRALYFLIWPSLIAFLLLGAWLLWQHPGSLKQPFTQARLGFVAVLVGYHMVVHRVHGQLKNGTLRWGALQLRLFAQGATVLLFTVVVLVLLRDRLGWVSGVLGLLVLGALVAYAVVPARKTDEAEKKP